MANADDIWTLGPHGGLSQRGFTLGGDTAVLESDNHNFLVESFLSMRNAFAEEDLTNSGLTGEIQWLGRHVTNDGSEELWAAANNAGTVACARRSGGAWGAVTLIDTPVVGNLTEMHSVTFNGKLFLAYNSAVNRLHVWDGASLRRAGLSKPSAPTVANTGAGAYAATARRYRVAMRIKSGSTVEAQSELSEAVEFTPSGAGTAARVTKPTTVDSATHWVVYGLISTSGDTYDLYEELSEIAVATATYDDSTNPVDYDGDAPPELGTNIPPPSAKFLATDGNRLILSGAWETSADADQTQPKSNRVWFSRPLNATSLGDDEVVPDELWMDIGDAGPTTGLATMYTEVYAFKLGSTHKLVPTQDEDAPFSRVLISENFGAVGQRCIANGETEDGFGAIFFADDHAVYRLAYGAVAPYSEPVGRDMRAQPLTADGSLAAYDPYRRVLLTQISNSATAVIGNYSAFNADVVKKRWSGFSLGGMTSGWTIGTSLFGTDTILAGGNATNRASVVSIASDGTLRLFVGGADDDGNSALRAWGRRNVVDGDIPFTARVRARRTFGPGKTATVGNPIVYYRNPQGSTSGTLTCSVSLVRDYNVETITQSFDMESTQDDNGITVKEQKLESLQLGDVSVLDLVVSLTYAGTSYDSVTTPTIDVIHVPVKVGPRR
jgi:hypothetical protein